MTDRDGRTERGRVVAATGAGSLLLLLTSGRTWVTVRSAGPLVVPPVRLDARDLAPGVPALALLGLAAAAGLLAAPGLLRRLVALVLAAAGLGAAVLAVTAAYAPGAADHALRGAGDRLPGGGNATAGAGAWPAVAVVAGLVMLLAGAYAVARSARWPALGRRYDAPAGVAQSTGDRERDAWRALDAGDDPTA